MNAASAEFDIFNLLNDIFARSTFNPGSMTGTPGSRELKDPHLEDAVLSSKADDTYFPPEHLDAEMTEKTNIWSKLSFSGANESNETQRGMQSRHLTMIGTFRTSCNAAIS